MASGLSPRNYTIEEYTRTVCPHCAARGLRSDDPKTFVDGMLVSHDDAIWMRRYCAEHGETESLYEQHAELWRARHGWQTPTSQIVPDRRDNFAGFPVGYRRGLPASHGQHSCITLLNVTNNCNFKCPTCFATSLPPGSAALNKPTLEQMLHTVDTVVERENGRLSVVMLSGGEPTVRADLECLIRELSDRPVTRIMLNTNGRRLDRDDGLLEFLAEHREKVEVYLQFDGLTDDPYVHFRGEPIAEEKRRILGRLNDAQVFTTLVMTVQKGVNDHQLKDVLDFGMSIPYCAGIAFQPVFGSGRHAPFDAQDRITPTGVLRALGKENDFVPLPCSHRDCCDIAYFLQDGKGNWRSLMDIVGRDELRKWIHLAANTISFENVQQSLKAMLADGTLQRLLSEQHRPSSLQVAMDLMRVCDCVPGVRELLTGWWVGKAPASLKAVETRTFRATVKMFMDAHTFHEARIRQCCVHVGTFEEDPRRYSFCWRWLFEDASDFPESGT